MKKPIEDLDKFREQFVRWTLRHASFRWPPRGEAMKLARVDRGLYTCASCKGSFKNKEVRLDHIQPVVPTMPQIDPSGRAIPQSIGEYVLRMFPPKEGLQVLCSNCHATKTKLENEQRAEGRRARKGSTGTKGRRRKASVGPSSVEGLRGDGQSANVRGQEIQPERVAQCAQCKAKISGRGHETSLCYQCWYRD